MENIRDVREERTSRVISKVAGTGKIWNDNRNIVSLQWNKHIMVGTTMDRRETRSTRCEKV